MLSPPNGITPLIFSEFGTRRRRSFHVQDLVMRGLVEGYEERKATGAKGGVLAGTSNVSDLRPTVSSFSDPGLPISRFAITAINHCRRDQLVLTVRRRCTSRSS